MSNKIYFTPNRLPLDNKVLEQDDRGYSKLALGAFNVFNSAGAFYTMNGIEDIFKDKSSSLLRRLSRGMLKSETGHPKFEPGMTQDMFFSRVGRIEETKVCAHIRDLELVYTKDDSEFPGSPMVIVYGWIKPTGPFADALQKALDNPDENIAFSIRSYTKDYTKPNGITYKDILQIHTWDWVTEPGIFGASKWRTLGVESFVEESNAVFVFDMDEIANSDGEINECLNCSLESDDERASVKELICNYNKTTVNTAGVQTLSKKSILDEW